MPDCPANTYLLPRSLGRKRDPGRVSSTPSESCPLPNPKSLVQHAHLLCPLSREAQQMRPSSISCKPPAGRTPVPIDNPMRGGFILLGLCCLWPSSYFPLPDRLAGPSGSLGGRGLPLLLFCLSLLCFPREHDRGGGRMGSSPPALAWTQRSFIHIRSFSRRGAFLLSSFPPSSSSCFSVNRISQIVLAGIYKKLLLSL